MNNSCAALPIRRGSDYIHVAQQGHRAMARYGIPRRFGVNDNEKELINWRRGLFRVWVLMSVAWLMGWTIFLIMVGIQGGIQTTGDLLEIPVLLFGPPVALLLFGIAAGWAFRGFKVEAGAALRRVESPGQDKPSADEPPRRAGMSN
jgi:hypothetical protein